MSFGSLFLFFFASSSSYAASPPPPVLVLIIESIKKRAGEEAVIETYGPELEYRYKPSGGNVSASSGDSKPKTARERMLENRRKQRERINKNSKEQRERIAENNRKLIKRFNDNISDLKKRYSKTYRSWDKKRPEFERDRKKFDKNLIDYNKKRKEDEKRKREEEEEFLREQQRLKALEQERKRKEEEHRKQLEREEKERLQKERARKEALRKERERKKREELRRKQEEERKREEAKRKAEERKRQDAIQKKKAEEEALRKRQAEEAERLRAEKDEEERQKREAKRQEEIRRKKSENAISWHVVSGALSYPIRNQSGRGTCASFASVRAIELKAKQRRVRVDISEQFFYWASKPECQQEPCRDQGSWPIPALKYGKKYNYPTERQCPYSTSFVSRNDTQTPLASRCRQQGPVGIVDYETGTEVSDIIGWIEQDHPVIVASTLTPNYYADEPWIDYRHRKKGRSLDDHSAGHAYLLVGYVKLPKSLHAEEGKYCFIAANSWGEGWGKGGHACISERWLETYKIPNPYIAVTRVRTR